MSGSGGHPPVAIVDNHMFVGDSRRGAMYMNLDQIPRRHKLRFGYDGYGELRHAQLARNEMYSEYNDQNQTNHYHYRNRYRYRRRNRNRNRNRNQNDYYNDHDQSQNQRYHDYKNRQNLRSRDNERSRSDQRQGQPAYEKSRVHQHSRYSGMNRTSQDWDRVKSQRISRYWSGQVAYRTKKRASTKHRGGRWQLSGAQRFKDRTPKTRRGIIQRTRKLKKQNQRLQNRIWRHKHAPVLVAKKVFYQTKRAIQKRKNLDHKTVRLQRGTDQAAHKVEHANEANTARVGKINMISGVLARKRAEMGRETSYLGEVVHHSHFERRVKKVQKGGRREGSLESGRRGARETRGRRVEHQSQGPVVQVGESRYSD